MRAIKKKNSVPVAFWKLLAVFFCALRVLWDIYWRFEKLDQTEREQRLRKWARKMLDVMGVSIEQEGVEMISQKCLRASNHVSWLDIVVLYACVPCRFIAKSEVKKYPVIGRIARNTGTLFLDRTNIKDAIRVSEHVAQALENGHCIAFFPEATTSEGEGLLPLHPSLFEGALRARSHVQTVVLRYHLAASTRAAKYAAYVHTSLLVTLWSILRYEKVYAMVTSHQPFQSTLMDTRHLICTRVQMEMEGVLSRLNYNPDDLPEQDVESAQMHLQFSFIDDALLWLMDAQKNAELLSKKAHNAPALMELRQLIHLVKGGASSVGFTHYGEAARVLEVCLSRWIKTKEKMSAELHDFIEQALEELKQWQTQLPQGDIAKEQVEKLLMQAKERIPLYDISEQMLQQTVIYNPVEVIQKGRIELVES